MADTDRARAARRLGDLLEQNRALQRNEESDPVFTERLRMLQAWQSQRLLGTHSDLLADPRFEPGVRFFVDDLYAPRDFSARDADFERAYPYMVKALPRAVLDAAADGAWLYVHSRRLDRDMVTALFETQGVTEVHAEAYAEAYRICDAYDARLEQIEIIHTLARRLDRFVRSPLVLGILRVARGPARLAGLSQLQDFLERGVSAFHHMGGSAEFVDTISRRERTILDRIFAGHPEPFDLTRG